MFAFVLSASYTSAGLLTGCTGSISPGTSAESHRGGGDSSSSSTGLGGTSAPGAGGAQGEGNVAPGALSPTPAPGAGGAQGEGNVAPGAFSPAPALLRRLTVSQYTNSIRDLLGTAVKVPTDIEPDQAGLSSYTFSNMGAYHAVTSDNGVDKFRLAAFDLASQVFSKPATAQALVGCMPTLASDPCIDNFLKTFGRRVFRRPLSLEEVAGYKNVVTVSAEEAGSVTTGLEFALAALLESPSFLYAPEIGEPDPSNSARLRYTGYEMASRLSFALLDTTPDPELLDAAGNGLLLTLEGLRTQAERLLAADRARVAVSNFFAESFGYDGLSSVAKDKTTYPTFAPSLLGDMRSELDLLTADASLRADASYHDLFDSRQSFVNKALAAFYGMTVPSAATGFVKADLPAERSGFLTAAGLLTSLATPVRSSPTKRGVFIRERVLCEPVPPPPDANVTAKIDAPGMQMAKTMRERLSQHATNPSCSACHGFFDPIGLGFETFDGIGKYRTQENGASLDTSGDLDGQHFTGAKDIAALLKANPKSEACLVRELYRSSAGHLEEEGEKPVLDDLVARFRSSGAKVRTLLADLVASDGFRYAVKPPQ